MRITFHSFQHHTFDPSSSIDGYHVVFLYSDPVIRTQRLDGLEKFRRHSTGETPIVSVSDGNAGVLADLLENLVLVRDFASGVANGLDGLRYNIPLRFVRIRHDECLEGESCSRS